MTRGRRAVSSRSLRAVLVAAATMAIVAGAAAPPPRPAAIPAPQAVQPAPNPPIDESCGVNVTLVLDASGSIESSHAVDDVRNAADAFLDALKNTDSTARVTQFATVSQQLAARTPIDDASLAQGGALRTALDGYYDPKPPRPSSVSFYQYDGSGNAQDSRNYRLNNSLNQYTNWDQGLDQADQGPSELTVFVTDGDPTAFDFNQPGDPFKAGPPPDVAVQTDRSEAAQVTIDRAVDEANQIKTGVTKSRMLAVGVGSALSSSASRNRLVAISGPQVVRDADLANIDSINDVDVALVTDFKDLAGFLRHVVLELCSPSLTIRKLAQSPGSADYQPAPDWDMSVTPTVVPSGTFNWILPNPDAGATVPTKTVSTNAQGFAQFQWEPDPAANDSRALVEETLKPGYVAGRPPQAGVPADQTSDYRCEFKNENGDVRVVTGEFADTANPSFTLDPIGQEIGTCTVWNSYDYQPAIALTKVNAPTELRGDLTPAAKVTSTYHVTNPGNTPLSNIEVTDDRCAPATAVEAGGFNTGDTNKDGRLDVGEDWVFACAHGIRTSPSTNPAGQNRVNTATVTGADPLGTPVTATATDDVTAFNPAISLTKLVNGAPTAAVSAGDSVTYTYEVKNTGNTPLSPVTLADDSTPDTGCAAPTLKSGDTNGDGVLDLAETWTYSCTATITEATTNIATVSGTPLNPVPDPAVAFPNPNPPVTASDTAEVTVLDTDLALTKHVDQSVVFPGTDVKYTYTATNKGNTNLGNIDDTGNPGWVTDNKCASVTQVPTSASDAHNIGDIILVDGLLNPGETWQFTCTMPISKPTLNVATITAQPVDAVGVPIPGADPLVRHAEAYVDIVTPGIALDKTALKPVVLDPDADPVGPNTPDPALYEYVVTNTGDVPIRDVVLADDTCSPVTFIGGDANGDSYLDTDESWYYGCSTALQRQQGTPPPKGAQSGLVTNKATVTGTPFVPGTDQTAPKVSANDQAQVLVIEPSLSITKTPSADVVLAGSDVIYTFAVKNTGDVGLELSTPVDDKCAPLVYTGGDKNNNGLLDGANSAAVETWTYTCTRPIGMPTAPDTTDKNAVYVRGVGPLGHTYAATATAEVRVIDPAISLVKTVSNTLVPTGTEVTYGFAVTNAGNSPLAADDVLAQVTLVDAANPAQPSCASPVLVSRKGGNQDDLLDLVPAETWLYECKATITDPTWNVALVEARAGTKLGLDVPVSDIDAAFVQPFHPAIDITKKADPTELLGGGDVTYTYTVRNTGDVPLADVASQINDNTCSPLAYVSGDQDGDKLLDTPTSIFEDSLDETWTFTCTTFLDATTTNTVVVTGTPTDPIGVPLCATTPCDVTAQDTAEVTVTVPGSITIVKKVSGTGDGAFAFDGDLGAFTLTTVDGSAAHMFPGLAPGTYQVVEALPDGWKLVSVACNPAPDATIAGSSATISLVEAGAVTCTFTNALIPEVTPKPTGEIPPTETAGRGGIGPLMEGTGGDVVRLGLLAVVGVVSVLGFLGLRARRKAGSA